MNEIYRPPENRVARVLRRPIRGLGARSSDNAKRRIVSGWLRNHLEPGEEPFASSIDRDRDGNIWIVTNHATYLLPKPTRANRSRQDRMQRIPHSSLVRIEEIHGKTVLTRVLTATDEGKPFVFSGRFRRREDPSLVWALSRLTGIDVMTVRTD